MILLSTVLDSTYPNNWSHTPNFTPRTPKGYEYLWL